LLYTYKEHGDNGIVQLAANAKTWMHGAQMAKMAGTANSQGGGIYVIPWLFAKACPRIGDTVVVWPEDGALITPLYLLAKTAPKRNLQPFIDNILGGRYGQKSADNAYPVLHPLVDNKLPEGAGFRWLGWDFIRAHSMEELYKQVITKFNEARKRMVD
jgi:ABC-type Fe3+ transport system substrate-binding protein